MKIPAGLFLYYTTNLSKQANYTNFSTSDPVFSPKTKATPELPAWLSATDTFDPQAPFFQLSLIRSHQVGS